MRRLLLVICRPRVVVSGPLNQQVGDGLVDLELLFDQEGRLQRDLRSALIVRLRQISAITTMFSTASRFRSHCWLIRLGRM